MDKQEVQSIYDEAVTKQRGILWKLAGWAFVFILGTLVVSFGMITKAYVVALPGGVIGGWGWERSTHYFRKYQDAAKTIRLAQQLLEDKD